MTKEQFDKKYHWLESKMVRPMEWQNDLMSMIASEREKAISEHDAFIREIIVRANLDFPLTEQELDWFEEGTDAEKCPEFMEKVLNTKSREGGEG